MSLGHVTWGPLGEGFELLCYVALYLGETVLQRVIAHVTVVPCFLNVEGKT